MLSCRAWMGNCYSDLGRMEEMLTHYSVAERLAEAFEGYRRLVCPPLMLPPLNWSWVNRKRPCPTLPPSPRPGFLDLHKLAICHEQLGHRGRR